MSEKLQDHPAGTRQRKWAPQVLLAAGGLLVVVIAAFIGLQRYGPHGAYSLSQANGLCASAFGQFAQATSLKASTSCSSVATAEQARGWLFITGMLIILGALAWKVYDDRRDRA